MKPQTILPAKAGAFPAASFLDFSDALRYAREMGNLNVCGVIVCPSDSYHLHVRKCLNTES